ncbi:MAG: deaminase [archaeon]
MILGLIGSYCAGKGTVSEHLQKKGFYYLSLSDALREEAKNRGINETRENLIRLGNELRRTEGSNMLAKRVIEKIDHDTNYVIDSIRNPDEAKAILGLKNSFLVWVDAPQSIRFKRCLERKRTGDIKTLEQFIELEKKELKSKDKNAQQILACKKLCKYKIINDSTTEKLHKEVDALMKKIPQNFERPSWDEYFLMVAKVVATRSNCIKRKVAAIIVKDKRIVSTGYNGTPRGVKNCSDGGCPRCNAFGESGKGLEECFCSHAEENSIVQAAYHGISVKDGELYTTFSPCLMCSKMIINAGIKKVVYNSEYPLNENANKLLNAAGIKTAKVDMKKIK